MKILSKLSNNKFLLGCIILGISFILGSIIAARGNKRANKTSNGATIPGGKYKCLRTQPYELAPEFERAFSLRNQRIVEGGGLKTDDNRNNCIYIQYDNLSVKYGEGTEGMFYFDKNSNLDKLTIFVDVSYKEKDDILTAILLQHEFTHISHFIDEISGVDKYSCVESEVYAFMGQAYFLTMFNSEEIKSLETRLNDYERGGYANLGKRALTLKSIHDLISMRNQSYNDCAKSFNLNTKEHSRCQVSTLERMINTYVINNPVYQEQCNLN